MSADRDLSEWVAGEPHKAADELATLRAESERLTALVEALETEGEHLIGEVASMKRERDTARAEVESLKARDYPISGLSPGPGYTLADVDAIEAARGKPYQRLREAVTERDALKAQLAEAQSRFADEVAAHRGLQRDFDEEQIRANAAEAQFAEERELALTAEDHLEASEAARYADREQLRVAREALRKLIKHVGDLHHVTQPLVGIVRFTYAAHGIAKMADRTLPVLDESGPLLDEGRAALSASAPKAEPHTHRGVEFNPDECPWCDGQPTHDASECECCEATAKARADLMRVAERCWTAGFLHDSRSIDLAPSTILRRSVDCAAIVAEVSR